jgi:hypothetical protein
MKVRSRDLIAFERLVGLLPGRQGYSQQRSFSGFLNHLAKPPKLIGVRSLRTLS